MFAWICLTGELYYTGGVCKTEADAKNNIEVQMRGCTKITKAYVFPEDRHSMKAESLSVVWHEKR